MPQSILNNVTPEFLLWSIRKDCLLRDEIDENHGHKVLRHLRPLRAWSDCLENDRIFEGICVQSSPEEVQSSPEEIDGVSVEHRGFRAEEIFEFYGGADFTKQQCHNCPANVTEEFFDHSLSGCTGMLQVDVLGTSMVEIVESTIDRIGIGSSIDQLFQSTKPQWYGLWARSPLEGSQLELAETIFDEVVATGRAADDRQVRQLLEFHEAIRRARTHQLPLDVSIFPEGEITREKDWIVGAHCYDCMAPMHETQRRCAVCRRQGGPHPKLRRRARGDRPYWSLSGFLGKEGAAEFLGRYCQSHELE